MTRQPGEYRYSKTSPTLRREIIDRFLTWVDTCPFCGEEFRGDFRYVVESTLKAHRTEQHPGRRREPPPHRVSGPRKPSNVAVVAPKPPLPDAVAWARDREFESLKAAPNDIIIDYKPVPNVVNQVILIVEQPKSLKSRELHVELTWGQGGLHVKILKRSQWYHE